MRGIKTEFKSREEQDQYHDDIHTSLMIACTVMSGNAWNYDVYARKYNVVATPCKLGNNSHVDLQVLTKASDDGRDYWVRSGIEAKFVWVGNAGAKVRELLAKAAEEIPQKA